MLYGVIGLVLILVLGGVGFVLLSGDDEDSDDDVETVADNDTAEEGTQDSAVTVSEEMQSFVDMFNGSFEDVEAAFEMYEVEGLDRAGIDFYDLENPEVVSVSEVGAQECYGVDVEAGITVRNFEVCWEDGAIVSAVDNGIIN